VPGDRPVRRGERRFPQARRFYPTHPLAPGLYPADEILAAIWPALEKIRFEMSPNLAGILRSAPSTPGTPPFSSKASTRGQEIPISSCCPVGSVKLTSGWVRIGAAATSSMTASWRPT